jgi:two-component system sensor histidine kinase/response regulator
MRRAYACGAADSVAKPIHSDVLLQKVRVFISLWQKSEALITKDRYMGMLAHDLRTPLFTTTMAATRLLDHSDPDVRALGARIARATTRMQTLTEDVLEFARATATQLPLERSTVDLAALCRELLEDLTATHAHIKFSWELPERLLSECDRARFQQALSNLLDNAIKYGNGWVRMRVQPGPHDVEITIENAGVIAPEQAERLFAPFTRGHQDKPGVGLGLYIVREIARAHGGEIEVMADPQSTVFRLRVPIAHAEAASEPNAVQPHSVITVTPEHGSLR